MIKTKLSNRGFTFIEIMLLSAILMIVASFTFRIIYAKEFNEWENNLWLSIGINPILGRAAVGVIAIITFVWINLKKKKCDKRDSRLD